MVRGKRLTKSTATTMARSVVCSSNDSEDRRLGNVIVYRGQCYMDQRVLRAKGRNDVGQFSSNMIRLTAETRESPAALRSSQARLREWRW